MKYKKSAKDIAFEKEREMFRKEIHRLETIIYDHNKEAILLYQRIRELESKLEEKDDWIRRLLEYTDMSEEDMRRTIAKEKAVNESIKLMNSLFTSYAFTCGIRL